MPIKQKIYLILFVFLIAFGLMSFLFNLLFSYVRNLSYGVEQQQVIIKNPDFQRQYQEQLNKLKADYEMIEPKLPLLRQSLLNKDQVVEFIKTLERAGEINNLREEIYGSSEEKDGLNFNLGLTGKFPDFLRFLEYIENSQFFLKISSIKIRALQDKEKQWTGDTQTNLEIKVYSQ